MKHAPRCRSSVVAPKPEHLARVSHVRHDALEEEADRAAELALAMPAHESNVRGAQHLRPAAFVTSDVDTFPSSVSRTLSEPGLPLENELRSDMERRFGHDFSRVRVHADHDAGESALDVAAQAYAAGHQIVFGHGQFSPHSQDGRRLIAHELAHVIQQSRHEGSTPRVLQRKPATSPTRIDARLSEPRSTSADEAAVLEPMMLDGAESLEAPKDPDTGAAKSPVAVPLGSEARPLPRPEARTREVPARVKPESRTDAGTSTTGAQQAPVIAVPEAPRAGATSVPRLVTMVGARREAGSAVDMASGVGQETGTAPGLTPEVNLGDLLAQLAAGARSARDTVREHAHAARAAVDDSAGSTTKKVKAQTDRANDAVRALMKERRDQVERTVRAHDQSIRWEEQRCSENAATYAENAKQALKDGFAHYRGQVAKQFDSWTDRFTTLNTRKADWLKRYTEWNIRRMWRKYSNYDKRFITDYQQPEARRAVQRDAAYEVVEEYVKEFNKANKEITPEIAKACENVKTEIAKSREEALREFDKGLPKVLEGIDKQLAAALPDIKKNARESREILAKGAAQIYGQLDDARRMALEHNDAQRARLDGQIESGRASAARQFERALPEAMQPIAGVIGEAVGMLTNTDEELDPEAADVFVAEVVDFTADAAEATGEVFAEARDTGIGKLAQAAPFARRGFATGRELLKAKLHTAGVEQETRLINFGIEADKYVHAPLTNLDQTFQAGVEGAERELMAIVTQTREQLSEPMEKAKKEISDAVRQAVGQQSDAYWRLGWDMHNAARQAAWRYDHDILKHVVDLVEVVLGFVLIVAILIAVAVTLVLVFGELIAAMIIGFAIGYFGAQAYEARRAKNESSFSALLGAIGDVTGFSEAKRAFTDPKMKPFDRGMAWGGFWLGLVGGTQGAAKFLKVIKVRFPKAFTNPFRLRRPKIPAASEASGPHVLPEAHVIPETPKIDLVPHEPVPAPEVPGAGAPRTAEKIGFKPAQETPSVAETPGTTAPRTPEKIGFKPAQETPSVAETPGTGAPRKPDRIGFKLPHEKPPAPETPGATGTPKPKRAGFELPHEKNVSSETPSKAAPESEVVSPRLHHRRPAAPETPAGVGRRRIGFVSSEEPAAPVARSGEPEVPLPAGETPGGTITDMPRAREMPGRPDAAAGGTHAPNRPARASAGESPRGPAGEAGSAEGPVKGTAVSTVEPEPPVAAPAEGRPSPATEARLADERTIQTASEKRIADQERLGKLEEELKFIEELRDAVGRNRDREIEDAFKKKTEAVKNAREDLRNSRRAENEAEAAQRIQLLRDPEMDPAAALHDPGLRLKAVRELEIRKARVKENDALIKANEADLAEARAKVAEREAEFEATRPGSKEGKQSRELTEARDTARTRLESARRHLESVMERTRPAERANQTHYERMQHLDRDINPQDYAGELSGAKGDFGEARMHDAMKGKSYEFRGSSKEPKMGKPLDQGLDGAYEKLAPAKDEPRHVAGEAKYDQATLRPGQEKWEWVDQRLDAAVGPKHANRMRAEGYEYWVMKYNPKTKLVEPTKLWEFRPNGKFAPEQYPGAGRKPLGAPHYEAPQL